METRREAEMSPTARVRALKPLPELLVSGLPILPPPKPLTATRLTEVGAEPPPLPPSPPAVHATLSARVVEQPSTPSPLVLQGVAARMPSELQPMPGPIAEQTAMAKPFLLAKPLRMAEAA
jgi:hypothetical protein